jgi:hypothetical protein
MDGTISNDVNIKAIYQQYLKIFILKINSKMFADAEELLESMPKIKRRV